MAARERQIHELLFPDIELDYRDYCERRGIDRTGHPIDRKWRNAKCDVQLLWSHIHYDGDVLVTNDDNFFKESKAARLADLGASTITRPEGLLSLFDRLTAEEA